MSKTILVVGDGGTGKTTFIKYVQANFPDCPHRFLKTWALGQAPDMFLVFSCDKASVISITTWVTIAQIHGPGIPCILVNTKTDIPGQFDGNGIKISTITGVGIQELLDAL